MGFVRKIFVLFEKNFYSLWINHKSGMLWNYGKNLIFSKYIYKCYYGSFGLMLQKYFSTNKKIFFGLNTYFNPKLTDNNPLDNKMSKVNTFHVISNKKTKIQDLIKDF